MALSIKALADGQLANSKGTIYTTPALTQAIVPHKGLSLVNSDSSARTVNLYVNRSGTSRRVIPKDMSLGAGERFVLDQVLTLEAGDLIEGDASAATVVDYVISGSENA
jgi:hypothetical protein